jgi:ACS family hexuronate transporter-like MFS transporter
MNRRSALAIMTSAQFVGSFGFFALTALTPFLKAEFGLSNAGVGVLAVSMYAGYLVALVPGGFLADYVGERRMLAAALGVVGVSELLVSVLPSYWMLSGGLFVLGVGYAPVPSGTNKGIFDWFPPDSRATVLSLKQTSVMIGSATAAATLPVLAIWLDWRTAMAAVGAMLIVSLGLLAAYTSSPDATSGGKQQRPSVTTVARRTVVLAQDDRFGSLLASGFFFGAVQFTLMTYVLLYLTEALSVHPAIAGVVYTMMQLAGAATRVVLGIVTDKRFPRRKFIPLAGMGMFGCLLCIPVILLQAAMTLPLVAVTMAAFGAVALGYNGLYLTIAGELVSPEETGAATAISVAVIIFGAVVTPPVFGYIVDRTGSYSPSLGLLAGLSLIAGLAAIRIGSYDPHRS